MCKVFVIYSILSGNVQPNEMATAGESSLKICDITSCSICLEKFKEPKVLPCNHTFCLECLDNYCEDKDPGEETTCPLCKQVFSIPSGGVRDLPDNSFIHQLLQVNSVRPTITTGVQESDRPISCEWCSDNEAAVKATSYCIECDQHICDRCSMTHKKAKVSRYHQVVSSADIPSSKEKSKLAVSYCDQHTDEQNRLYCYDCKMVMCHKCVNKHNQHKLSDVNESAETLLKQLKVDVHKVSANALYKLEKIKQIETDTKSFMVRIASTESEISQKNDQLISLIQSHQSQLMEELNSFKDKILKGMRNEKDEMERQFVITERFKKNCQEMINKGTACDISLMAHDLHARAEELVKTQNEPDCHQLSGVEITFKPSVVTTGSVKNYIGELVLYGQNFFTVLFNI